MNLIQLPRWMKHESVCWKELYFAYSCFVCVFFFNLPVPSMYMYFNFLEMQITSFWSILYENSGIWLLRGSITSHDMFNIKLHKIEIIWWPSVEKTFRVCYGPLQCRNALHFLIAIPVHNFSNVIFFLKAIWHLNFKICFGFKYINTDIDTCLTGKTWQKNASISGTLLSSN